VEVLVEEFEIADYGPVFCSELELFEMDQGEIPACRGCRLRNYPGPVALWTMLPRWNTRQLLVFLAAPARFRVSENSSSRFKMMSKREKRLTAE
jgi:hypothetical protein